MTNDQLIPNSSRRQQSQSRKGSLGTIDLKNIGKTLSKTKTTKVKDVMTPRVSNPTPLTTNGSKVGKHIFSKKGKKK
jgi:hypothetical protein